MTRATPPDPSAFFREMLGQWETMANQFGAEAMKSSEFAQAMHGVNAAKMAAQAQAHEWMDKALAAANMPSRSEVEDISARLARIEEAVGRIEAMLAPAKSAADRPKPKRTRTPSKAKD